MAVGFSVAFIGLALRAWSSGHIRKNQDLAVSGPYSRTRNPLYLGSFIMGLGFTIASGIWWIALLFIAMFIGIYFPVMRIEARELTKIFGDEFEAYAEKVPLFFPSFSGYGSSGKGFELSLYLRYREYQAAIGFVFIAAVLVLKSFLLK